jgi:hypothetical protein
MDDFKSHNVVNALTDTPLKALLVSVTVTGSAANGDV